MNKYYEVVAIHEGAREIIYGSFLKSECEEETGASIDIWKEQGYKSIKIISRLTDDNPDPTVYDLVTARDFWLEQAPSYYYEMDEDELLKAALSGDYLTLAVPATPTSVALYLVHGD